MDTTHKKPLPTAGEFVETVTHGECAIDISLKRQPSGFRHHAFAAPVKLRRGRSGNSIITRTYSSQDEEQLLAAIAKASARCRQLDAELFGVGPAVGS